MVGSYNTRQTKNDQVEQPDLDEDNSALLKVSDSRVDDQRRRLSRSPVIESASGLMITKVQSCQEHRDVGQTASSPTVIAAGPSYPAYVVDHREVAQTTCSPTVIATGGSSYPSYVVDQETGEILMVDRVMEEDGEEEEVDSEMLEIEVEEEREQEEEVIVTRDYVVWDSVWMDGAKTGQRQASKLDKLTKIKIIKILFSFNSVSFVLMCKILFFFYLTNFLGPQ